MALTVEQQRLIADYKTAHAKECTGLSDAQILSIMTNNELIILTESQKKSLFLKDTAEYDTTGLVIEPQNDKKEQKGNVKTELETNPYLVKLNEQEEKLKKAKNKQGFIGKGWDWFKNTTGIGDGSNKALKQIISERELFQQASSQNLTEEFKQKFKEVTGEDFSIENLEKFKKGELSKVDEKINGYTEGQAMAADVAGDIISGIAAVGIYTIAVAAAPFSGGASIAVGVVAATSSGALIKTGIKYADAKISGSDYTTEELRHDAMTGGFSGLLAPITGGLGGAVGKTVATKIGIQAVKQVGKEVAEEVTETSVKQGLKAALTNPTGYEYVGGKFVKRIAAMGAEMATDGSVGGALDGGFRAGLDNEWDAGAMVSGFVEGGIGGLIMSPLIGGGMKLTGKSGQKFSTWLPFGKIPEDVPQVVIPKKTNTDLYPESDITSLNIMKKHLQECSGGLENIEIDEMTARAYTKEVKEELTKGQYCFDSEADDVAIGEKYTVIRTKQDGTYRIYKSTQSGSNPGFWAEHIGSGDLFYLKTANGQQNITEHVSSQLYRAAGIDTPDMNLVAAPGFNNFISVENCWIKSKAITDLEPIYTKPEAAYEGFAVDAWLANWDAVCSGNTLVKNGVAVRVDFGGTLNFRARGAKKNFGNQVPELSTLLDSNINPESAKVFQNMTREDLIKSLERVQSVTDKDIQDIYNSVNTYMNPEIFSTIQNRKTYLGYILNEAKNMPLQEKETISAYIKRLEGIVETKYKPQITKMNFESDRRNRILKDMTEQRNNVCSDEDQLAIWDYKGSSFTANTCIQQGDYTNSLVTNLDLALSKTHLTEDIILYRGDHFIIDMHTNVRYSKLFPEYDNCHFSQMRKVSEDTYVYDSDAPLTASKYEGEKRVDIPFDVDAIVHRIFKKGRVVEENQFVSTTVSPQVAKKIGHTETDIIYIFKAHKGLNAVCPEKLNPENYGRNTKASAFLTGTLEGSEAEILLKRGFKYRMDNLYKKDGQYYIECTIL